jgi:hypothetical protein
VQTLQFRFHSTDPDFKLKLLEGVLLTVTIPFTFPEAPVTVNIDPVCEQLTAAGCAMLDVCMDKFTARCVGEKYPNLRATLRWLDRNLEALFALANEKEDESSEAATTTTTTTTATTTTTSTTTSPQSTTETTETSTTTTTTTTTTTLTEGDEECVAKLPFTPRSEWAAHRNANQRRLQLNHHAYLNKGAGAVVAAARSLRRLPDKKVSDMCGLGAIAHTRVTCALCGRCKLSRGTGSHSPQT